MSRAREAGARFAGRILQRLPGSFVAILKSELRPVGRLDYAPKTILMCLNSPWQVYRLRSCAKEPETVQWLERELRPGDCLYDVGANVGAYSLVAFAITGGNARVFAFEPGFGTFAELCRNIHLNDAQESITPLAIALGSQQGLANFRYSDTTPGAALHSWGTNGSWVSHGPDLVLPTATYELDALIVTLGLPPPTLLKVDVDGPELEVLEGAAQTLLLPSLRTILIELDGRLEASQRAEALIVSKGFRVRSRHDRGGGEGPVQNVIFIRD
jgi:FkbM family methyltransferase